MPPPVFPILYTPIIHICRLFVESACLKKAPRPYKEKKLPVMEKLDFDMCFWYDKAKESVI